MPQTQPVPAESASDAVFFGIMNGLEAQRFVPGQRLVEADLAAQFGVGRNSVREALQRLAAEGIVELLRHRGAAIRSLSLQETLDVLDVAERMTGLLARSAARAVAAGQPALAVTRALQQLRAADRAQDGEAFARARRAFYRALLEAGGSRELRRLFPSIHMPIVHAQQRLASLQQLRAADRAQDGEAFARARRAFYRALLEAGGSRELRRLFPSIHMPIVHAQQRLASLQKLRLRDYRAIGQAVAQGEEDAADEAGMAHVRHVREEILRTVGEAGAVRAAG